jgi:hypothetical protein
MSAAMAAAQALQPQYGRLVARRATSAHSTFMASRSGCTQPARHQHGHLALAPRERRSVSGNDGCPCAWDASARRAPCTRVRPTRRSGSVRYQRPRRSAGDVATAPHRKARLACGRAPTRHAASARRRPTPVEPRRHSPGLPSTEAAGPARVEAAARFDVARAVVSAPRLIQRRRCFIRTEMHQGLGECRKRQASRHAVSPRGNHRHRLARCVCRVSPPSKIEAPLGALAMSDARGAASANFWGRESVLRRGCLL